MAMEILQNDYEVKIMSETEFNMLIARNIKTQMNLKGFSQKDIADKLGVSQASVSAWCKGTKIPRMDKIDRLCAIFGCLRSDLLEEKDETDSDAKIDAMLQEMKENPQIGMLLSSTKGLDEESITLLIDMAKKLRGSYRDT